MCYPGYNPPTSEVKLGSLLLSPTDLDENEPINKDAVFAPELWEVYTSIKRCHKGTWTSKDTARPKLTEQPIQRIFGAEKKLIWELTAEFDTFKTIHFEPSAEYIQKTCEYDSVQRMLETRAGLDFASDDRHFTSKNHVWLVTGLKVFEGASLSCLSYSCNSLESKRIRLASRFALSFDWEDEKYTRVSFGTVGEQIFAYHLKRITIGKPPKCEPYETGKRLTFQGAKSFKDPPSEKMHSRETDRDSDSDSDEETLDGEHEGGTVYRWAPSSRS
jgi:hypothetical protein